MAANSASCKQWCVTLAAALMALGFDSKKYDVLYLALLPVLTSSGRGADVMVPMAIPAFGGMFLVMVRVLTVPVLYAWLEERRVAR